MGQIQFGLQLFSQFFLLRVLPHLIPHTPPHFKKPGLVDETLGNLSDLTPDR
jgi:hypothetical protein